MKLFNQLPRWLAGAFLLFCAQPALATLVVQNDPGGNVAAFLQKYEIIRAAGDNVVVRGECDSACTLMLAIVPRKNICATAKGSFGFHSPKVLISGDDPDAPDAIWGFDQEVSDKMWLTYPADVRKKLVPLGWHGQEHPEIILVPARAFVQPCKDPAYGMAAFPRYEYYAPVEEAPLPPPPAPRQQPAAPRAKGGGTGGGHAAPHAAPHEASPVPHAAPEPHVSEPEVVEPQPHIVVAPVHPVAAPGPTTEEQPSMKLPVPEFNWLWDIGFFLLIGIALGVVVNAGRNVWKIWKATRAVANIAEGNK